MSVLEPRTVETKSGQGKRGPWVLYRWEMSDGTKASTFDKKISDFLTENIGRPVNVDIEQTEKGKNLVSAWPLNGTEPPPPVKFSSEKKSGDDYMRPRNPGESRIIAKQACLKAAVELYARAWAADVIKRTEQRRILPSDILHTAGLFLEWVFREDGVRHIKGAPLADAMKEVEAIKNDTPADDAVKAIVVSMIPTANADAKAVLHNYSLKTIKDVQERLTAHVAELFFEANGPVRIVEVPF